MTGAEPGVVIVGASIAGLSAAEALRRAGFEGLVTLIGNEVHPPYDRPPLSKQILKGDWEFEQAHLRAEHHFEELGVDLVLGAQAVSLDLQQREVRIADGRTYSYRDAIVATGVRPRRLPGTDDTEGVHVMRYAEDAARLRGRLAPGRRLVVVGAGFLGGEVASVARSLGADVTMIEPAPVPLAHAVGAEVGEVIAQLHREHGVDLRTGIGVNEVTVGARGVEGVVLSDGETIEADDVLVAVGSIPNTEWLDGSGLTIGDGVVCDEYSMAAPGVAAAGDVARWYNPLFGTLMRIEHRTTAAEHGIAVARNLMDPPSRKPFAPVPYFWSDQYDVRIQAHGYLRDYDECLLVSGDYAERRFLVAYRKGDRIVGVLGVGIPPKALAAARMTVLQQLAWNEALAQVA